MRLRSWIAGAALGALAAIAAAQTPPAAAGEPDWQTLGLMRVRDMTPFGIARLDMLPAHAVAGTRGTFALEVNVSYQNTWAASNNVKDYLEARGVERGEIGAREIEEILALPGDAYLVDGELGLVDLTLHYRATRRFGIYATIPYFTYQRGFLDSTIESFHDAVGFSNAGREFAPRNEFLVVVDVDTGTVVIDRLPGDEFGDPVLGARYALPSSSGRYRIVFEAAGEVVLGDDDRLVTTGSSDYGVQVSLQRFFDHNALYLSLAEVFFQNPDRGLSEDTWVPTVVAGWETRLTAHTNFILQLYASESVVQETELDELKADKIQATIGIQRLCRGNVLRFGITENLANFDNTPDVGFNFSLARIVFGKKTSPSS